MPSRVGSIATAALLLLGSLGAAAQTVPATPAPLPADTMLKEDSAQQLSSHVWVIRGYPNVVVVVGKQATLVVDTGLGTVNGQVVARTAAKLGKGKRLYLTTTHFHPEHAAGEGGFPPGTILIRARAQQEELVADQGRMLENFRRRGPELLAGFKFRTPDRVFDKSERLDLGGVHARLIWAGPAHTRGDEEVLVEEDSVLVTGDVVQNRTMPNMVAAGIGPRAWMETVNALRPLRPKLIVPDHSDPGPGVAMIEAEYAFLEALDARAHALKLAGVPVEQAATTINAEMKARYPDWTFRDLTNAVMKAYAE